jgi:DNA-binding transcriptional regulator YdaS (Cro superfamily)
MSLERRRKLLEDALQRAGSVGNLASVVAVTQTVVLDWVRGRVAVPPGKLVKMREYLATTSLRVAGQPVKWGDARSGTGGRRS